MLDVGDALPGARPKVTRLLRGGAMDRDTACAIAFRLLDRTGIRVGNEEYAEQHDSYGLTTMLVRHLDLDDEDLYMSFPARSGQQVTARVHDTDLAIVFSRLLDRPKSHTALAYPHEGEWRALGSDEVNDLLRRVSGVKMTAKDFRTWHAIVIAARARAKHDPAEMATGKEHQRAITETVEQVANHLQNTTTIARNSYIDPRVFDRFAAGDVLRTNTYRQAERGLRDFLTA